MKQTLWDIFGAIDDVLRYALLMFVIVACVVLMIALWILFIIGCWLDGSDPYEWHQKI